MSDELKSSARAWGGADAEGEPPAYSGSQPVNSNDTASEAVTIARRAAPRLAYDPLRSVAALATVPYQKYDITDGLLSPEKISLTVKHSDLYSNPQYLLPFILEQAYLPPKPVLHIVGSHYGDRIDFDITLNLAHLLNLNNHKWRLNSAQVSPLPAASGNQVTYDRNDTSIPTRIATGVKQFCKDRSENKSYTLTRTVDGLPTEMLAGQVRNLAASVKYRGFLKIEFVCERSKIIVHKQPSNWFSNMLGLHAEKKFEMLETVWNLSDSEQADGGWNDADVGLKRGQEWWQSWASTIRNAIISKYKGNIGIEDWIETRMGRNEPDPRADWSQDNVNHA